MTHLHDNMIEHEAFHDMYSCLYRTFSFGRIIRKTIKFSNNYESILYIWVCISKMDSSYGLIHTHPTHKKCCKYRPRVFRRVLTRFYQINDQRFIQNIHKAKEPLKLKTEKRSLINQLTRQN